MRYSVFEDPDHELTQFDFDDDWVLANTRPLGAGADDTLGSALNATDPDLSAFKARGGKLISYHGWADALIPGSYAVEYYESVIAEQGGLDATADFYRLFMAPGVAHCRGGPGPDRFDAVTALERWGRGRRRAGSDGRFEGGRRQGDAHAAALPLSAGGAAHRPRQHRRRRELRVRRAGLTAGGETPRRPRARRGRPRAEECPRAKNARA